MTINFGSSVNKVTNQEQTDFGTLSDFHCELICCRSCTFCCWASTKEKFKSVIVNLVKSFECVKNVSYVDQLSFVQNVTNVPVAAPDLPVGARLHKFRETWAALGASS